MIELSVSKRITNPVITALTVGTCIFVYHQSLLVLLAPVYRQDSLSIYLKITAKGLFIFFG